MRQSAQAQKRYLIDQFPADLIIALGSGALAGCMAAPLGYLAAMHFFERAHTLDRSQEHAASLFLGIFAALVAGAVTALAVFLFRYFRRLYRFPV